jgi:menaquinone-dependent protoporphyrinogen oxidase
MKLLIVYGTTEGQTRKIAEFLKMEAEKSGAQVTLCDATREQINPEGYDAVMIGASVHMQKYQTAIAHYIKSYMAALNDMRTAFFSVSLTAAAGEDKESWKELEDVTARFLIDTGWKPTMTEQVAGALRFTEYDFFKKFIMRQIAKKAGEKATTTDDHEYTDWKKVRLFLDEFLSLAKVPWPTLAEEIL